MNRDEIIDQLAEGLNMTYGAPNIVKDGDTLYRAEMCPDEISFTDISDWGDVWGRTGWGRTDRYEGYHWRPDGYTGNAEIIHRDRDDVLWWEPPADGPKRGTPEFDDLRQNVSDLLEYGFSYIKVERCEGVDGYGRPIVRAVASLSGIEPYADGVYLREIVAELFAELEDQQ